MLEPFNGERSDKVWTEDMDEYLRRWYPTEKTTTVAYQLGRSVGALATRAGKLGIKKQVKTGWSQRNVRGRFRFADDPPPVKK